MILLPRRFNRTPVDIARIIGSRASFVIDGCKDSVTDSPNSASPLPKARHLIGDITPNSARKGWKPLSQQWLMSAGIYVDRIISEGLPIPEFSANEFNADVFAMHAASLRLPVVVRGALNIPSAAFTRDALLSVIDKHACSYATAPYASLYGIEAKRSTYEEYIREWLPSGDSSAAESDVVAQPSPPPYIFDSSLLFAKAEVMSGMSFPAFTESRYNYTTLRQFAMGPALSGAPPHFHPSAWNGVAVGAKLWLLSPPLQSTFQGDKPVYEWFQLCSHVSCWRNAYVAVQGEGDMVYVPDNWEHTVLNLADTIAVAFEAFA